MRGLSYDTGKPTSWWAPESALSAAHPPLAGLQGASPGKITVPDGNPAAFHS